MLNVKFFSSRGPFSSRTGLSVIGQCFEVACVDTISRHFSTAQGSDLKRLSCNLLRWMGMLGMASSPNSGRHPAKLHREHSVLPKMMRRTHPVVHKARWINSHCGLEQRAHDGSPPPVQPLALSTKNDMPLVCRKKPPGRKPMVSGSQHRRFRGGNYGETSRRCLPTQQWSGMRGALEMGLVPQIHCNERYV